MADIRIRPDRRRPVDPASVHRRHAGTVFLTDVQLNGADGCVATAELPEGHPYYAAHTADGNRRLDPMLVLEACRQAVIYLGHTHLGVVRDTRFLLDACAVRIAEDAPRRLSRTGPVRLTMTAADTGALQTGRRLRSLAPAFALTVQGTPLGSAQICVSLASPPTYSAVRLRRRGSVPPSSAEFAEPDRGGAAPPTAVGRTDPADVILADVRVGPVEAEARLIVPVSHKGLFDHPLDHVPGSLLVEAARQFGTLLSAHPAATVMTEMTARFHAFAELDAPIRLLATPSGGRIVCRAVQHAADVATVTVRMR